MNRYTLRKAAALLSRALSEDFNVILGHLANDAWLNRIPTYKPGSYFKRKPRHVTSERDIHEEMETLIECEAYADDLDKWVQQHAPRVPFKLGGIADREDRTFPTPGEPTAAGRRRDALTPTIEEAVRQSGSTDPATVFNTLRQMAVDEKPPFNGLVGNGLKWTTANNKVQTATVSTVRKRLNRATRAQRPRSARVR
jgi:hypothetical protein